MVVCGLKDVLPETVYNIDVKDLQKTSFDEFMKEGDIALANDSSAQEALEWFLEKCATMKDRQGKPAEIRALALLLKACKSIPVVV